ncbi:MAG: IS4 family transposase [Thermoplasmata archaeon]
MRANPSRQDPLPRGLPPTLLQDTLLELFPTRVLRQLADESGFVRRHRKVDPVAFFWTVTLEAGVYLQRSLEQLRFAYNQKAPKPLYSYASFYDRFTPELVEFLHRCVAHGLAELRSAPGNRLSPKLRRFEDLLIQDSTVVRLYASLAKIFPPTRASAPTAGVKIATLLSVRANGPRRVEIVPENTNDHGTLKIGPWVKGSVLLLDLGFYKHQGFARIEENGGFYLSRLSPQVNPRLLRSHRVHREQTIELEGKRWKEVVSHLRREILDAEVEIDFDRRRYGGRQSRDILTARLVAIWNEEVRRYHTYLTNIPAEVLGAEELAALYGCR